MFYVPRPARFLVTALFALDSAMGEVVRTTTEPMIGQIRLAWWRERLEELDEGRAPAEPNLQAAAEIIAGSEVTGREMAEITEGWEALLEPFPWDGAVADAVADRGRRLFAIAARIVGARPERAGQAGQLWALVDVAKHCSDEISRKSLIDAARSLSAQISDVAAEAERPLTMLGLLARRDLERWPEIEPQATPGRAWAMIRHRLTGRL